MTEDAAPKIESDSSSGADDVRENGPVAAETPDDGKAARPPLSPAAQRALAEAEARRKARYAEAKAAEKDSEAVAAPIPHGLAIGKSTAAP